MNLIQAQQRVIDGMRRVRQSYPNASKDHAGAWLGGRAARAQRRVFSDFLKTARGLGYTNDQGAAALRDAVDMFQLEEGAC